MKWKEVGDHCSKEFFQAYNQRSSASHIRMLEDSNGQLHTNQTDLANICQAYYQKLYKAREPPLVVEETQAHALCYMSDKLSLEAKAFLESPITLEELKLAMKDMATGKSPGLHGITLDFYNIY